MKFRLPRSVDHWPQWQQWLLLCAISLPTTILLYRLHIPAALLMGPMASGIVLALLSATIKLGKYSFSAAQACIGILVAQSLDPDMLHEVLADWPVFFSVILLVILLSNGLGYLLARHHVLPGSSAIWGASPGGASAMMVLAQNYGADIRLVAVMQYLRVVMVVLSAAAVDVFLTTHADKPAIAHHFTLVGTSWGTLFLTLTVGLGSAVAGKLLRIPAGAMLAPLAVTAVVNGLGWASLSLPPWLLALSYAGLGWMIGLRFDRQTLRYSWFALPKMLIAILILMALCALLGVGLSVFYGVDPLTAYLATSPGGLDSIAIIAASSEQVNISFVMALQTCRLLMVIAIGPIIARFIANRLL